MKKINIKSLSIIFVFTLLFSSCAKDDNVASKATFWPDIVINGEETLFHPVGTPYVDESATVKVNGEAYPFETVNEVDPNAVGWYLVTYSAVNEDGISASQVRTVIVVDSAALDEDLTGSFSRVGQAGTVINWIKTDEDYTYTVNNVGGVAPSNASYSSFNVPFTAYHVAPGVVAVPPQEVPTLLPFYCLSDDGSSAIEFNATATSGQVGYVWVCIGGNFGTAPRTFVKI